MYVYFLRELLAEAGRRPKDTILEHRERSHEGISAGLAGVQELEGAVLVRSRPVAPERDEGHKCIAPKALAIQLGEKVNVDPEGFRSLSMLQDVVENGGDGRGRAPLPKRAVHAMLRAAVEEPDPSFNRVFVEPCVWAYGRRATVEGLLRFFEGGTARDKAGVANALYWIGFFGDDDLGELRTRLRTVLLRGFIETPDLDVRRAILGRLPLAATDCPEDERPLVAQVVEISRGSDDEYLRHRVEVQLGAGGPFLPVPGRHAR